jgi:hypothetical protein
MTQQSCEDSTHLDPERMPLDRFREMLENRAAKSDRKLALMALRQRSDISAEDTLRTLRAALEDDEEPPATRVAAALEIGRLARPGVMGLLLDTLAAAVRRRAPTPVLRAMADVVLRSGGKEARAVPEILRDAPEVLGTLRLPMALLSFRENLDIVTYDRPDLRELLEIDKQHAQEIRFSPAKDDVGYAVAERAADFLPGLQFDPGRASAIDCSGQRMAFLPVAGAMSADAIGAMAKRKAIVGVLSVFYHLESDAWDPKYVVVSQPAAAENGAELLILTTTGALAWFSPIDAKGSSASFILRSVERAGAQPSEIAARVDNETLAVTSARSAARKHRKRTPERATSRPPRRG